MNQGWRNCWAPIREGKCDFLRRDADAGDVVAVAGASNAQEAAGGPVTVDLRHVRRSQMVGFARLIQINAFAPMLFNSIRIVVSPSPHENTRGTHYGNGCVQMANNCQYDHRV